MLNAIKRQCNDAKKPTHRDRVHCCFGSIVTRVKNTVRVFNNCVISGLNMCTL